MMPGSSMLETARVLAAQLAVFQALLLLASALHKAWGRSRALAAVRGFGAVPASMAGASLSVVIAGEIASALLLCVPAYRAAGAMLAAAIWSVYLGLILRAILQNRRDLDCGCSFGPSAHPLGAFQVTRNGVLTAMAAVVAGLSAAAGAVPVESSQVLGGLALLALYGALDQVMALQPLRGGEVS